MIESLIKVLANPEGYNQLNEEWKDWHDFEVPEEIYDKEFSLVNIPYLAMYMLDIFKSKQTKFIKNVEKTLKVPWLLFFLWTNNFSIIIFKKIYCLMSQREKSLMLIFR